MNPLPEKKHFTAKECADAWGLTVQDLLQYGAYGKIELMVYLELTEGTMYVFRKGERLREEIKRSAWGDFQILSPMVCRDLQVNPDKLCPVTSIEPDQTIKKLYEDDDLLGIDLFQPIIKNGERRYQMIKYKEYGQLEGLGWQFLIQIRKDTFTHQSSATIELFDGREWKILDEIFPSNMMTEHPGVVNVKLTAAHFKQDRDTLEQRARIILLD